MFLKTLSCGAVLACGLLVVAGLHLPGNGCPGARMLGHACASAPADDKKDDKDKPALSGSWVKKEGELKIEFADKDIMKVAPHGNDEAFVVLCTYTVEKGEVKAKVTGFEGKEEAKEMAKERLPVGSEFSFKWEVKGDTGTLDDLKGDKAEVLKSHLEGKYDQKK
jgi:hypothetical protein